MIDLRLLIANGVHFGHQTSRWSPKMEPYIWGYKNGIHLIDVMKTAQQLEKAAQFLESVIADGRTVLLVGTKKAAQESIHRVATANNLPFVMHRWVGGTFTNHRQVRKAIANLMNYEEILDKSTESNYTKKELNLLKKRAGRLGNIVGGIRNLSWPVGAVVVVDVKKENVVVKEAIASGIPVVAIVDTNCDPSNISIVIPGNDDSPRSISVLMDYLGEAIARGQKLSAKRPMKEAVVVETIVETLYDEIPDEDTGLPSKRVPVKAKPKKVEIEKELVAEKESHLEVKKPFVANATQENAPVHIASGEPTPLVNEPKLEEPKKGAVKKALAPTDQDTEAAPKKAAVKPKADGAKKPKTSPVEK